MQQEIPTYWKNTAITKWVLNNPVKPSGGRNVKQKKGSQWHHQWDAAILWFKGLGAKLKLSILEVLIYATKFIYIDPNEDSLYLWYDSNLINTEKMTRSSFYKVLDGIVIVEKVVRGSNWLGNMFQHFEILLTTLIFSEASKLISAVQVIIKKMIKRRSDWSGLLFFYRTRVQYNPSLCLSLE